MRAGAKDPEQAPAMPHLAPVPPAATPPIERDDRAAVQVSLTMDTRQAGPLNQRPFGCSELR